MKFTSSKEGSAYDKSIKHLSDSGYKVSRRHPAPNKHGGVYEHPTKPLLYVTHYKTGVSHIDEEAIAEVSLKVAILEQIRAKLKQK